MKNMAKMWKFLQLRRFYMKFKTYQNKKLKAIQVMALKAWLEEDWDSWKMWIDKRDKFEKNVDKKDYEFPSQASHLKSSETIYLHLHY